MNAFENLQQLIETEYIEFLDTPTQEPADVRLVYMMNDAVESFILLKSARTRGTWDFDPEEETEAEVIILEDESEAESKPESEPESEPDSADDINIEDNGEDEPKKPAGYALLTRQNGKACTIFFDDLEMENHSFNYGGIGHFWVKKWENLRQIEYKIAIVSNKAQYLGLESLTEKEREFISLKDFPPLGYLFYNAADLKWIPRKDNEWYFSKEAFDFMDRLAEEVGDRSFRRKLKHYFNAANKRISGEANKSLVQDTNESTVEADIHNTAAEAAMQHEERVPLREKYLAGSIARSLRSTRHAKLVDTLREMIDAEAAKYPRRTFPEEEQKSFDGLLQKAEKRKKVLEAKGIKAEVYREEPFQFARDQVEYGVYVMSYKNRCCTRTILLEKLIENSDGC